MSLLSGSQIMLLFRSHPLGVSQLAQSNDSGRQSAPPLPFQLIFCLLPHSSHKGLADLASPESSSPQHCLTHSFTSFKSLLKCYLLNEAYLSHRLNCQPLPQLPHPSPGFIFLQSTFNHPTYIFSYLFVFCLLSTRIKAPLIDTP